MRVRPALPVLFCLAMSGLTGTAFALEWQNRAQEMRTAPLQEEIEAVFTFINDGKKPVVITDIQTDCDCLEARPDRKVCQSGERGAIKALFTVGDRLGLYERSITVQTDEGAEPVRLSLRVDVPAAAEVTPRTAEWKVGDPVEGRAVELVVAPELWIHFSYAAVTSTEFTASITAVEEGRRYRVTIAPQSTATPASAAVRLRGKEKSGRDVVVSAYAYVR